jgi:hypothetical protein
VNDGEHNADDRGTIQLQHPFARRLLILELVHDSPWHSRAGAVGRQWSAACPGSFARVTAPEDVAPNRSPREHGRTGPSNMDARFVSLTPALDPVRTGSAITGYGRTPRRRRWLATAQEHAAISAGPTPSRPTTRLAGHLRRPVSRCGRVAVGAWRTRVNAFHRAHARPQH